MSIVFPLLLSPASKHLGAKPLYGAVIDIQQSGLRASFKNSYLKFAISFISLGNRDGNPSIFNVVNPTVAVAAIANARMTAVFRRLVLSRIYFSMYRYVSHANRMLAAMASPLAGTLGGSLSNIL